MDAAASVGTASWIVHEVRPGDSLWRLSQERLGSPWRWRVIFERNRDAIADPDRIYPRQRIVIPDVPPARL